MNIKDLQGFEQISTLYCETITETSQIRKSLKLRTWLSILGRPHSQFIVERDGMEVGPRFKENELMDAIDTYQKIR